MKRLCFAILCIWLTLGSGSAHAQWFYNPFKKAAPAVPPEVRVGQLITVIKSEQDERKRLAAVEEIRDFDTKSFPQIVDILADVAQHDSKASVRGEAVTGLVRIRPITQAAGQAIEYAASKDENWRNRMNAQAALVRYRLAGYSPSAPRNDQRPQSAQSNEPPLNGGNNVPPLSKPGLANAAPGTPPPIIYYDHTGKVIPAPKGFPTTQQIPQVNGTPASNPGGRSPFSTIGSAPVTPPQSPAPPMAPRPIPQNFPPPQAIAPIPNQQPFPQPQIPEAIEPNFRPVNRAPANPEPRPLILTPQPVQTPAVPLPPIGGPSLDLPPLPINGTPIPAAPVASPVPQGPSLESSAVQIPSGRMDPSPRLTPASNDVP